ncbi:MAG TPA: hypothetical protein VNF70_00115 [Pyrinomonadaceae bacterium]|nr:hypothetical protein [Pyrinomonadaceae bacterium]
MPVVQSPIRRRNDDVLSSGRITIDPGSKRRSGYLAFASVTGDGTNTSGNGAANHREPAADDHCAA